MWKCCGEEKERAHHFFVRKIDCIESELKEGRNATDHDVENFISNHPVAMVLHASGHERDTKLFGEMRFFLARFQTPFSPSVARLAKFSDYERYLFPTNNLHVQFSFTQIYKYIIYSFLYETNLELFLKAFFFGISWLCLCFLCEFMFYFKLRDTICVNRSSFVYFESAYQLKCRRAVACAIKYELKIVQIYKNYKTDRNLNKGYL